jgi:hypothetical protein
MVKIGWENSLTEKSREERLRKEEVMEEEVKSRKKNIKDVIIRE